MAPKTEQKIYVGIGLDFETGGLDCRECACTQIALQAVRFDTWQVFDRYQAYIAPYGKQDAGLPRRKVLRTRHEQAKEPEQKIYVGIGLDFETGGLDCRECACTQIALQAVRFDTWQVFDRYQAYIAPYGKQDAGLPRRKVLRTRHEQAKEPEYVPMKYEQTALDYSAITMEMLRTQGVDMKKVAGEVIAFAKRSTLSKGYQCKPVLVGQNIAFDIGFLQQLMNYAGLAAEFEKTFSGTKDYYGNFQPHYIDTLVMGRLAFAADPEVTSYKLELVASKLGVELDDAHDAAADVTATLDILGVYTSRLRQTEGAAIATQKKEKTRKYFKI